MKIQLLSNEQIRRLHEASLQILATIGVHVPHEEMLRLLGEAGADSRPAYPIRQASRKTGARKPGERRQELYDLRPRPRQKAEFGVGKRNYNSIAGEALWLDDDLTRRYATLDDVRTAAAWPTACPAINIVGSMADPHELPAEYRCVVVAAEQLKNTTKPITFWFHDRASARFLMELFTDRGRQRRGGDPRIRWPIRSSSRSARCGSPSTASTCCSRPAASTCRCRSGRWRRLGATAVGTLAGTMAQENAEILAGVCIVQLIHPGTPVCYGGIPHAFDMRTTQLIFAGPEQALMAVGMTEMGKFYGLPVYINVGLTDSKIPDAQAGLEAGITLACGAMAGADIFGHLGICGVDQGDVAFDVGHAARNHRLRGASASGSRGQRREAGA